MTPILYGNKMIKKTEIVEQTVTAARWLRLALAMLVLLFAGVIYTWSIIKKPLATTFGWSDTELAFNFTLTMCFFIVGILCAGLVETKISSRIRLLIAAVLVSFGFIGTSLLTGKLVQLYVCYGICSGAGIGFAYNTILTIITRWFPDRKGIATGCMMMSFGFSALILGKAAEFTMSNPAIGWQGTYMWLGITLGIILFLSSLLLKLPPTGTKFPEVAADSSNASVPDITTAQMVRRASFWKISIFVFTLGAIGNTIVSFARDYAISVGTSESFAVTLVGLLSVCNGLARLVAGAIFDRYGIMVTRIVASILSVVAVACGIIAACSGIMWLGALSICLCGGAYGFCPSLLAEFASAMYGEKNFSLNFGVLNIAIIPSSLFPTLCSALLTSSGSYAAPFIALMAVAVIGLIVNLTIRKA